MVRRAVVARVSALHHASPKLILAAADYAAGKDVEPPPELITLWDWRDTGTPPHAGGLADQPAGLLRRGKYLEACYTVMKRWYSAGGSHFNAAETKLFKHILELRKAHADTR